MKEMLSEEQKEKNKINIITYLRETGREGIEDLIAYLEESDFFTAPASTKFHGNYPGALAEHSLNVNRLLFEKNEEYGLNVPQDSLVLTALCHDLCKVDFYNTEIKWRKDKSNKWESYEVYGCEDKFPFGHGEKSVVIMMKYIKLSDEEMLMVRYHMGPYEDVNSYRNMNSAITLYPSIKAIFTADIEASTFLEKTLTV